MKPISMVSLPATANPCNENTGQQLPDKDPSEGCGVLIQDQQNSSAQLDGTIEGAFSGVVAYLMLQLMLVVCIRANPVPCLIGQLP